MSKNDAADVLLRIEQGWCIEGDYADDEEDKRHPVERRLAAMQAMYLADVEKLRRQLEALRDACAAAHHEKRAVGVMRDSCIAEKQYLVEYFDRVQAALLEPATPAAQPGAELAQTLDVGMRATSGVRTDSTAATLEMLSPEVWAKVERIEAALRCLLVEADRRLVGEMSFIAGKALAMLEEPQKEVL